MKFKDIKLVVALGNPGPKYEGTFHNVGISALDVFKASEELAKGAHSSIYDFIRLPGFMNQSGVSLYNYLKNSKYGIENCLIIHDDSDIAIGAYKFSFGKSSGGQRGVQNIIDQFGTDQFWRLRIGIRDPEELVRKKAGNFVLKKMSKEAKTSISHAVAQAYGEFSSSEP